MPTTNKADNTTALNNAGSWTAGVPNSTTVALWNLVTQRNASIGGSVTMGCIANTGSALAVINNTSGATLTISGSVTDVPGYEGYGVYLTNGSLTMAATLSIVNDQSWYVASGRYVDKTTTGWGGTGKVTLDAASGWYSYTTSTHTGTWEVVRGLMVASAAVTAPFGQAANTITLTGTLGDVGLGCRTTANVAMLNNLNLSAASLYLYNVDNGAGYLQLTGTVNITNPATPTFVVGNLIYMDGAITCTNGLTVTNSGSYFSARNSNIYLRGVNSGFYGPITVNNTSASVETSVRPGTDLATNFPNVTSIILQTEGSAIWVRNQNLASSTSTNAVFTGLGWVWPGGTSSSAVVCTFNNENALSGLTGALVPTNGGGARNGLLVFTDGTTLFCVSNLKDFPTVVQYYQANTSAASGQTLRYISGKLTHIYLSTKIYINNSTASAAIGSMELYADQGTGALVLGDGTTNTGIHKIGLMTGQMTFTLRGSNSADNTIAGVIQATSGTLAITKTDGGKWVLSGTNTFTGPVTLTAGTLGVTNGAGLGAVTSTSACTLTAGTLQLSGNITVNKSGTAFTTSGASIQNLSGNNTLTFSSLTMNNSFAITTSAGSLNITNPITGALGPGAGYTLTVNGPGTLRLNNATNSYANSTAITSGTVEVTKLSPIGTSSSLGSPAAGNALIYIGATGNVVLSHIGSTVDSTDRAFNVLGGPGTSFTINSNGTGGAALSFSGGMSFSGAGAHTVVLTGGNGSVNTYSGEIQNGVSGPTNITKDGSCTWQLTGPLSAQGTVTVNAGSLYFGAFNRSFSNLVINSTSGTVTIATGNQIEANTTFNVGTVFTPVLVGSGSFTVASGITESSPVRLEPDSLTSSNTFTGSATINGCVDLIGLPNVDVGIVGNGEFFGTNNTVTVNSGGMIRTKSTLTSDQRGRAQYNHLTINGGAVFKFGLAA